MDCWCININKAHKSMQYNDNSDHMGRLKQLLIAVRGIHNRPTVSSQLEFYLSVSKTLWCA